MRRAIPALPQYVLVAWCLIKQEMRALPMPYFPTNNEFLNTNCDISHSDVIQHLVLRVRNVPCWPRNVCGSTLRMNNTSRYDVSLVLKMRNLMQGKRKPCL
jgi:hypothetical protein